MHLGAIIRVKITFFFGHRGEKELDPPVREGGRLGRKDGHVTHSAFKRVPNSAKQIKQEEFKEGRELERERERECSKDI